MSAEATAPSSSLAPSASTEDGPFPVLAGERRGSAQRFAAMVGDGRHPVLVFSISILGGLALLIGLSIGVGFLLTHELARTAGIATANRHVDAWLAQHRTPGRTEASLIGSIMAGGVVLPIIVAIIGLVSAVLRKWRIAAFAVFGLIVESSAYRATTLVIHEHRPHVIRLENLPVNASYPSGHTAASIAVYGGLAVLLASKIGNRALRVSVLLLAAAIPVFVGLSRMYRGMHYPLDVLGGALLGLGALTILVFACRAAGWAAHPDDGRESATSSGTGR